MSNRRTLILIVLSIALFVVAFYPTLKTLLSKWANSEDYAHAFLTLPIIGYMIWQKRSFLNQDNTSGSVIGIIIAISSAAVYLIAWHARILSLSSIAMIMTILGILAYLRGFDAVKLLCVPFVLMLLLIPIPSTIYSALTLPLQLKVSQISEVIVRLFSVPVFREGNVLTIPDKVFQIVQACSGMRSMITLATLSLIIGYFSFSGIVSKVLLIITSIPVAIFVNVIRVVSMIIAFHFFNIDLSVGTSHTSLGIGIFIIALAMLFMFQRIIEFWETRYRED
jgi:exosortase